MNKTCVRADIFGKIGQKGDHIMFRFPLNLVDAVNVEGTFFPNRFCGLGRDHAKRCLRVTGMRLNLEPDLKLTFLRPDGTHFWPRISRDHAVNFLCVGLGQVVALGAGKNQC